MKSVHALVMLVSLLSVSGCTVLGLALDTRIDDQMEKRHPAGSGSDEVESDFTTAGVEADIAIVKHIADKLTPEPQPPRLRCSMDHGVRICYEVGSNKQDDKPETTAKQESQ